MDPFPCHGSGILDHGVYGIEQGTIPVLFENSPTAFNRVVLTVVGRIIRETDSDVILLDKFHQTLHELRSPTVVLRSVI